MKRDYRENYNEDEQNDHGGGGNDRDAELFAFMLDRFTNLSPNDQARVANACAIINTPNYGNKESAKAEIISLLILV